MQCGFPKRGFRTKLFLKLIEDRIDFQGAPLDKCFMDLIMGKDDRLL